MPIAYGIFLAVAQIFLTKPNNVSTPYRPPPRNVLSPAVRAGQPRPGAQSRLRLRRLPRAHLGGRHERHGEQPLRTRHHGTRHARLQREAAQQRPAARLARGHPGRVPAELQPVLGVLFGRRVQLSSGPGGAVAAELYVAGGWRAVSYRCVQAHERL